MAYDMVHEHAQDLVERLLNEYAFYFKGESSPHAEMSLLLNPFLAYLGPMGLICLGVYAATDRTRVKKMLVDEMVKHFSNVSTTNTNATTNNTTTKNIISGACGDVYMVTAYVPGPQVLTNSLKALFGDKVFGDFMPGNIIPSYHPNLTFKEVKIENGVAKVYLGGSFSGSRKGVCDATLAIAQIKETAKSYPNVKSVEIYQGGEKID